MSIDIRKFLAAAVLVAATSAADSQARGGTSRDAYGYLNYDGPRTGYCAYDYVSLDSAGTPLLLVPGRAGAAVDDRAAVLPLAAPFELYRRPATSVVVSGNGYLAMAGSFAQEDGSDFSNDCPLPALAENPAASQERIYLYHDDLRAQAGGLVRQAHFTTCPRASDTGATEACTVIEWNGFERVGPAASSSPLRAQAVLYHGTHEVVLQYASVDDSGGTQATVGLQGLDASSGRNAGCNQPARVVPQRAMCFFDPRFKQRSVAPGTRLP